MNTQPLGSIIINKREINWIADSGIAIGVQKYTKTHVRGREDSVSSWIETIIELSIKQANGNEVQATLRGEEIRVRDGQRVSVIWGCREGVKIAVAFINHDYDSNELHWLKNDLLLFKNIGEFVDCFPPWFVAIMLLASACCIYMLGVNVTISTLIVSVIALNFVVVAMFFLYLAQSTWKIIRSQLSKMVVQLRY